MTKRLLFGLLFIAAPAFAQLDPLRNVSGTTQSVGAAPPWATSGSGAWTFFHGFSAHVTQVSQTGPEEQNNEVFSTNWIAAGLHRHVGERAFVLLRGRVSLEPITIPDNDGYPQMLQFVSEEAGGVLVDRMRPHDLIGEAAVQAGWRPSASTLVHAYVAAVGDPALGAAPFALRASGVDFAEAPFSYDVQEPYHDATSVVTLGFASRLFAIEGSVFHDAVTFGDHTEFDDGDIDSSSVRATLTPSPNLAIQVSRGTLGEDDDPPCADSCPPSSQRKVSTASLTYGAGAIAATALWTRREREHAPTQTAYGIELTLRGARHTAMARAEWVDRPDGFPSVVTSAATEQTTHFAVGYIWDFISRPRLRAGAGVNIDYHTQSHELPAFYGHKPQSIYAFVRVRSAGY